MVNHWPSRRGGETGSEPRRVYVAGILKHLADSILDSNPLAAVVMMGDLNDEPVNRSIHDILGAKTDTAGTREYHSGKYDGVCLTSSGTKGR